MNDRDEINLYFDGLAEGIERFAHWKNGVQYVGTCGKTLKQAKEEIQYERKNALEDLYV